MFHKKLIEAIIKLIYCDESNEKGAFKFLKMYI